MADNKAFWEWVKETYGEESVQGMRKLPWEIPDAWKAHYNYWQTYIQPATLQELSPGSYATNAISGLQRAMDRGDITYDEYEQGVDEVKNALAAAGVVVLTDDKGNVIDLSGKDKIKLPYKNLIAWGADEKIIESIPKNLPFYADAATTQPDWAYDIEQTQIKQQKAEFEKQQKESAQQQAQAEKEAVDYRERKTGETAEDWMNRVQQFEATAMGNIELAKEAEKKSKEEFEAKKEGIDALTPQQRADYERRQITQRQGEPNEDATGGDLTQVIDKARELGIDTRGAESALGLYAGNETNQVRALKELRRQVNVANQDMVWEKGGELMKLYPTEVERWQQEERQRRLNLGAATGEMEGAPIPSDPGGFYSWSQNNPQFEEFVKAETARKAKEKQNAPWLALSRRARKTTRI